MLQAVAVAFRFKSVLLACLVLAVAACQAGSAPSDEPLQWTDGLGRAVALSAPAQRIVSLAPSNAEILFAVGAGPQVVGRDDLSDYPAEASAVSSIGSTFGQLNTEAIVALQPDLVLAASITAPEQVQALEDLGLMVYVLTDPSDFEGLYRNLQIVGELTARADEAAALAAELEARVTAVEEKTQGVDRLRVFYEADATDPTAPWTTGSGTFQSVLIDLAGGSNVAGEITGWGQFSLEQLVAVDPQVIVFTSGPFVPTTSDSLAARPGWGAISAVADGRVYPIDTNWVDRPGPRLVEALEAMARFIHPELFD
ncbi:MAG: ABC transporter substrate-binding protein [Anaerolineales bacterium]